MDGACSEHRRRPDARGRGRRPRAREALAGRRLGERFHSLCKIYPAADLIGLWNDDPDRFPPERTQETWLARTPLRGRKALALPVMPFVWRTLRRGPYDWAILPSHAFPHHVRFRGTPDKVGFVSVHSPARSLRTPVPAVFVIAPSNATLRALFQRSQRRRPPAVEDFGIMPVEALAAGAPVVAQAVGGTAEIVQQGVSGALATFDSAAEVGEAIATATATSRTDRVARAQTFGEAAFARHVRAWTGR